MARDYLSALNTVKNVLAADFSCAESDFDKEGVCIFWAKDLPGRRHFPFKEKSLRAASMGKNVVIACNAGRLDWANTHLSRLTRDGIFEEPAMALMNSLVNPDGQFMAGPDLKFICAHDLFHPCHPGKEIDIKLVEGQELLDLYKDNRFPNSLGPLPTSSLPMAAAAVARYNGELAGVAAVCIECDLMWQVGVDTLEPFRRRGVGKAAVSAVTDYVLKKGVIPYYSTTLPNTASKATAASLGYKPAWVEIYAREQQA